MEFSSTRHVAEGTRLTIRAALPGDAAAVQDIYLGMTPFERGFYFGPRPVPSRREIARWLQAGRHVVADVPSGELVAVVDYAPDRDEPDIATVSLAVSRRWRRLGIGSAMAGAIETVARADGIRTLIAEVRRGNRPSMALVERHVGPVEPVVCDDGFDEFRIAV